MLITKFRNKKNRFDNLDLNSVISASFYSKSNKLTLQLDGIKCEYDTFEERIKICQKSTKSYLGLICSSHYDVFIKGRTLILRSKI